MNEDKHNGERIAKRIARAGLCSRRDAEKWIEAGRVQVNGRVISSPALNITHDDVVVVDGKPMKKAEMTRLFLFHKPAGLVTTHKDEHGRPTVFDHLPKGLPRLLSVGRLDLNTEGLLLLTNDGALARFLELPVTGLQRTYRVRVLGRVDDKRLDVLKEGIKIESTYYKSILAVADKDKKGANTWVTMTLQEGKNREIRRVMEALNLQVNRLIRVSYGPFKLADLPPGDVAEVPQDVLRTNVPDYFRGSQ